MSRLDSGEVGGWRGVVPSVSKTHKEIFVQVSAGPHWVKKNPGLQMTPSLRTAGGLENGFPLLLNSYIAFFNVSLGISSFSITPYFDLHPHILPLFSCLHSIHISCPQYPRSHLLSHPWVQIYSQPLSWCCRSCKQISKQN